MNVFNRAVSNSEQKPGAVIKQKLEPASNSKDNKAVTIEKNEPTVTVNKIDVQTNQSQTRNISFERNDDNSMYVQITDENDDVVRTIPADEKDPRFIELIAQSTPGMIINNKS